MDSNPIPMFMDKLKSYIRSGISDLINQETIPKIYEYDSKNGYKFRHKNHFDINWAFISFGHILKTPLLMKLCGKSGGNPKDIAKLVVDHLN